MAFNRNQKLMVFLLAGMAVGVSSFATSGKTGKADFASELAAPETREEPRDEARNESEEFMQDSMDSDQFVNLCKKAQLPHDAVNVLNERSSKIDLSDCKVDGDYMSANATSIFEDADGNKTRVRYNIRFKSAKALDQKLDALKKRAQDKAKVEKDAREKEESDKKKQDQLAQDIENCKIKEGSDLKHQTPVADTVKAKMQCFGEQAKKMSGDKLEAYKEEVVKAYISENLKKSGNMMAQFGTAGALTARNDIMQLQNLMARNGLLDQDAALQFQYVNNVINARLPINPGAVQANTLNQLRTQDPKLLQDLNSSNVNTRNQAQAKFNAAVTQNMMALEQGQLTALITQPGTAPDAAWSMFNMQTQNQLNQMIQVQRSGNKAVASLGSAGAPYNSAMVSNINMQMNPFATSLSNDSFSTNPFNTNNAFGPYAGLDQWGLNAPTQMTDSGINTGWNIMAIAPPASTNLNPAVTNTVSQQTALNGKLVSVPR